MLIVRLLLIIVLFLSIGFFGCVPEAEEKKTEDKIVDNLNADKLYFVQRDNKGQIISEYIKDKNLEADSRIKHFYDSVGSLKMKVSEEIFDDSINYDTVFYSYINTDRIREVIETEYSQGKILRKRVESKVFENERLVQKDIIITFFNKYSNLFDTTSFRSIYSYVNGRKIKYVVYSNKQPPSSNNFVYDNDLVKTKVLVNELNGDTLRVLSYKYNGNTISEVIENNYKMNTVLVSKYNTNGILTEAFWKRGDKESDTVKVQFLDSINSVEYYWNKDFYPWFTFNPELNN